MADRPVPQNLDAEEALIGAVLTERSAILVARSSGVRPQDFYKPVHAAIYAAVMALYDRGQHVDPVTVESELQLNGKPKVKAAEVMNIQARMPASAHAREYARLVVDASTVRALLLRTETARDVLYDPSVELAEKVGQVETIVHDADLPIVGGGPSPTLDEYLSSNIELPPYLIPNSLRRRERLLIVAEPGAGKTTFSRQVALMGSQGIHPWSVESCTPMTALIVDCENPDDSSVEEIEDLVGRARHHLGDRYDPSRIRIEWRTEGIDVLSRRDNLWLQDRLAANRPDVLVMGPLYKLHNVDDNNGQESKRVVEALDDLRKRYDVALILETHAPKECWSIRGDKAQPLHIKGSSVWTQWPDFVFGLDIEGQGNTAYWVPVRPPRFKRVWPRRMRRFGVRWPWEVEHAF